MRTDIVKYFVTANVAAPPIGIYTAGRFCQLVSIPLFDSKTPNTSFLDIMKKANAAYINATTTGKSNLPAFPAILGLTMMDSFLTDAIRKPDTGTAVVSPADLVEILGEFGVKIPSGDFTILQNFVNDQGFKDAVGLLMGGAGPEDPWADAGTTLEQMVFWTGKTEYAIP
jgi:hypothetical protein